MKYQYKESGLDYVWLENGFTVEDHPNYGQLVSIQNVRGLHDQIGIWLATLPRRLTGAEFKFLRTELDNSQRVLARLLGVGEQSVQLWEKSRNKPVANQAAERLLRAIYMDCLKPNSELKPMMERITELDASLAAVELHLANAGMEWKLAA